MINRELSFILVNKVCLAVKYLDEIRVAFELTLLNGKFLYIDQILRDQRKLLSSTFLYFIYIMRLVKGFIKLNQSL